jgi:hypothetical protein
MTYSNRVPDRSASVAKDRRRWIVKRVWVIDQHGTHRRGTVWLIDGDNVRIRVDEVPGITVLPVSARGTRWDYIVSPDREN